MHYRNLLRRLDLVSLQLLLVVHEEGTLTRAAYLGICSSDTRGLLAVMIGTWILPELSS